MECRLCKKGPHEIGGYLERVNEKGVPGIWECRPVCGADLPQATNLLLAIEGDSAEEWGCPVCHSAEVDANTPRTVYECGSSDYDQRQGTFIQAENCKAPNAEVRGCASGETLTKE